MGAVLTKGCHAMQERVPKRWALSYHCLTEPFGIMHSRYPQDKFAETYEHILGISRIYYELYKNGVEPVTLILNEHS